MKKIKSFIKKIVQPPSIIDDQVILPIDERYKRFKIVWTPNIAKNRNYIMTLENKDWSVFVVKDWKRLSPNYHRIEHLEYSKDKENYSEVLILARNQDETFTVNLNWIERFTGHWKVRQCSVKRSKENNRLYFIYEKFKDSNLHYPSTTFNLDNSNTIEYDNWIENNIEETYEETISPHISENWAYILKVISPVNWVWENLFYINDTRIQLKEEFLNIPNIEKWPVIIRLRKENCIDNNWSVHFNLEIRRGWEKKWKIILNKWWFIRFIYEENWKMIVKKHYSDENWINIIRKGNWMIDFEWKTFPQSAFDRYLNKKALE